MSGLSRDAVRVICCMLLAMRAVSLLLTSLLLCGQTAPGGAPARRVTVRMINGTTGAPLLYYPLTVSFRFATPGDRPHFDFGKTGAEGEDFFPVPERAQTIQVEGLGDTYSYRLMDCWSGRHRRPSLALPQVLATGVVLENICNPSGKVRAQFQAKPGELILFARKPNPWERFWLSGQR